MKNILTKSIIAAALSLVIMSCSGDNKKRGTDYSKFKTEVTLTPEQENIDFLKSYFRCAD